MTKKWGFTPSKNVEKKKAILKFFIMPFLKLGYKKTTESPANLPFCFVVIISILTRFNNQKQKSAIPAAAELRRTIPLYSEAGLHTEG